MADRAADIDTDCDQFLAGRLSLLEEQLATVNRLAAANGLPDAVITTQSGLKLTPQDTIVPDTAQVLIDQAAMRLPSVKITELLLEVDQLAYRIWKAVVSTGIQGKEICHFFGAVNGDGKARFFGGKGLDGADGAPMIPQWCAPSPPGPRARFFMPASPAQ